VHKSKIKQITLAVCLAFMPLASYAAGLGKLNVNSGLGEPLKAEIELLSVTPEELSTLVASIASEEAYAAQGVTRLGIHNNIQIEVTKNTSGSPVLRLRSTQPISDPYLDMLIQVDWASGRLQREYTVLLDPPGYKQIQESATPMAISPATVNPGVTPSQSATTAGPISKKAARGRRNTVAAETVSESAGVDEVTTQRGDTLGEIARQVQVDGVSLDQMLVGLYEQNKSAFVGGNINRLKVGQIIRVPSKEVLTSISRKDASQTVKVHSDNWAAYRNNLAGAVAETAAMAESEQKQTASGKIGAAEDKATPAKTGPQDVVKLSAGEKEAAAKDGSAKEFESKITALQEETTAREKSLKEAQERTAALEKQIQDMQKLLALKSQAMTDAQKNAETTNKEAPSTPSVTTPATSAAPAESAAPAATPQTESQPSTTSPEAAVPPPAEPTPTPPANVPAAEPKPVAIAPEVSPEDQTEQGFLASIGNLVDLTVLAAIGGIALLAGVWMFLRNKRRRDLDSFERGILTSGGLRANTVFGNTTGTASTSDTSFLTDFAQSADGSMIDTNDVDPIAEAEVYMAYGRDAQAEEILKDAISKEPKRYELHLKLLEMYANRKDTSAFEAIAGELYTTLGAADPTWVKVAEMGHAMEPENPLYDVSGAVASAAAATQQFEAADFASSPANADTDLDFSLGDDDFPEPARSQTEVAATQNTANNESADLAFDIGSFEPEANLPEQTSAEETKGAVTDNTMDFDLGSFDLGGETLDGQQQAAETTAADTAENMPVFDLPESNTISFEAPSFEMPAPPHDAGNETGNEISFDMDFNLPTEEATPLGGNTINDLSFQSTSQFDESDISFEPKNEEVEEISFDIPIVEEPQTHQEAPNSFDLSTISLDLNDESSSSSAVEFSQEQEPLPLAVEFQQVESQPESADVDIKLDLVAAYLDMDDKEGARELLEEVLKDGGPNQQAKARDLMAGLG
jgi:pilus assembly protein FimV